MAHAPRKLALLVTTAMIAVANPIIARAADQGDYDSLKAEVQSLRSEMAEMRQLLKQQGILLNKKATPEISKAEVQDLKEEVKKIANATSTAKGLELESANSTMHIAGYASAGYTDQKASDGRFDQVQFSPIFHYQYKDLVLLESELELQVQEDGTTETGLEYLTLNLLLNDYATLLAGKFLSPIGQFRQNLHPGWINKLPSAPSGFGHDGAAPSADIGVQLRGGVPVGDEMRANYALYVANGPELTVSGGKITTLETGGFARDADNNKVYGGRVGFIPIPKLEVGFSGAFGNSAITAEADRNYTVLGTDVAYQWRKLDLRGEYIRQSVDALAGSSAPDKAAWEAFYLQSAYKFPHNFEGVVRYGNYNSPVSSEDQEQWVFGVNYLLAPQLITKLAYEFNDGETGSSADGDRLMGQISYGF